MVKIKEIFFWGQKIKEYHPSKLTCDGWYEMRCEILPGQEASAWPQPRFILAWHILQAKPHGICFFTFHLFFLPPLFFFSPFSLHIWFTLHSYCYAIDQNLILFNRSQLINGWRNFAFSIGDSRDTYGKKKMVLLLNDCMHMPWHKGSKRGYYWFQNLNLNVHLDFARFLYIFCRGKTIY